MNLRNPMFRWEPVAKLFRDDSYLQRMLDFEAALAHAEATSGIISSSVANTISKMPCRII
jgi:adenylosuccinate lyase